MSTSSWNFMAEEAADWRAVMLFDTAARAGLLGETGTVDEIASQHGLDSGALTTVLEGLESFGLARRVGEVFAVDLNHEVEPPIRHHADVIRSWTKLEQRLTAPRTSARAGRTGADLARWLEALAIGARAQAPWVVDTCLRHQPAARTALDLGGGHGVYAAALAERGCAVVIQDRPAVIEIVEPAMSAAGVEVFPGDFHAVLPGRQFDLVLLAGVAHTMAPERLAALYRRLRPVVSDDGALVVMTMFGGPQRRRRVFAVQMLSTGNGGGTFSADRHRAWLRDAGFSRVDVSPSSGDESDVIVARR